MRILFITRKWPPAMGGMETYSVELVEELRRDHEVDPHVLPGKANGDAPGALAILWFGVVTAWRVLAGRGSYDVVHGGDMAVWPLVALASLRSRRARMALSAHGTDVSFAFRPGLFSKLYSAYMRLGALLLPSSVVIANSDATAELARKLGYRKAVVVPLATRSAGAAPAAHPGRNVLFAGRLVRRKGFAWFAENVLPRLPGDIELQVAGTVWDEAEAEALKSPRVTYLGMLPQDELKGLMAEALCVIAPNISVGPGHFEGFGLVAVEAAASGAIVLAADIDGFRSSVLDGLTGRLLPSGDANSWVDAIQEVAAWSPKERLEFSQRAQRAARDHFNWRRVADQTVAAYAGT